MITGVPIANGDGSYTFPQDDGESLVLRGDAADRAFKAAGGAPPSAAPVQPTQELVEAAQPGPDRRLASNGGPVPFDPGVIAGMNAPPPPAPPAESHATPSMGAGAMPGGGKSSAELTQMLDKPMPAPESPAGTQGGQAGKGAVFFQPRQQAAAPSGGGQAAPGKPVPIQQTVQGVMPESEGQVALDRNAIQARYGAAEGLTDVEAKKAEQAAKVQSQVVDINRNAEVEQRARETERQRLVGEKMQKIDTLAQESAAGKIDPDHLWKDKGAETQFATAVLMGVSAWAEGMGGGKAYAVDMVNKAIDRDMSAQEKNLANKREDLHAQTNLLGQLRQEFGDREAASAAFRATKLATAGAQLEEINARNLPAEQKAKLAEFAAGLNADYTNQMKVAGQIAYSRSEKWLGNGPGKPAFKEDDVKHLDTELRKEKVPESYNALDQLEKHIDTSGTDDVAGLGIVKQHVPDLLISDEGLDNRRALDRAVLSYAHATGRVTPAEVELVRKAAIGNGNKQSIRAWIRSARSELSNVDRSVRASVPEAAQGEYVRRGGLEQRSNRGPTPIRKAGE